MKPRFVQLSEEWERPFKAFLNALEVTGDNKHFQPHPFDDASIKQIIHSKSKDYYCLLVEHADVLGYGLLRWHTGYSRPSLGIAVHPKKRKRGYASALMEHLHEESLKRDSRQVRLRVKKDNPEAIKLYEKFGYHLHPDQDPSFLEGVVDL